MDGTSDAALGALSKFLLATCLAALANAVLYVTLALFETRGPPSILIYFLLTLLQSFVLIAAFALLLAIPITILLVRSGKESLAAYVLVGAVAATVLFELMHILLSSDVALQQHLAPRALLYSARTGGLPGALFGLFWWQFGRKPLLKRTTHG